jgi:hypothetical protein
VQDVAAAAATGTEEAPLPRPAKQQVRRAESRAALQKRLGYKKPPQKTKKKKKRPVEPTIMTVADLPDWDTRTVSDSDASSSDVSLYHPVWSEPSPTTGSRALVIFGHQKFPDSALQYLAGICAGMRRHVISI